MATAVVQQSVVQEEYGDLHKIVLQGMMASGFLDLQGVKNLFGAACDYLKCGEKERADKTSMPYVQKVVRLINEQIKPYHMAIKSASCELTGKKFFIFMVTAETSLIQMQQMFSKIEIDIFQKVMDKMLRKYPHFSLPMSECINILRDIDPRASLTQADDFIKRMIELRYFTINDRESLSEKKEDITLGVRGIREFEPLLSDLYRDVVRSCSLCKLILLHGYRCPGCMILFHRPCFAKYNITCKQCKSCSHPWPDEKVLIWRSRDTDAQAVEVDAGEQGVVSVSVSRHQSATSSSSSATAVPTEVPSHFEPPPTPGNFLRPDVEGMDGRRATRRTKGIR